MYAMDQRDFHQQRLVDLGALTYCRFEFKNINQGSREAEHLSRTCHSQVAPGCDQLTFWDCTPVRIGVWCHPENRGAWESFVAKYDVPDYWEIRDQSVVVPKRKAKRRRAFSDSSPSVLQEKSGSN